jgi:hypothetical protein
MVNQTDQQKGLYNTIYAYISCCTDKISAFMFYKKERERNNRQLIVLIIEFLLYIISD